MRDALTGSLVFLISCCFADEARLFAAPNDDWENQVIEGLASADLAGTLTMILESVVEEGAETTQMKLANCLKSCKARFGADHLKTKSVQLGIEYAHLLKSLSAANLGRLLNASKRSYHGFELMKKGQPKAAIVAYSASLEIQQEVLGERSISVAILHANIGTACSMMLDLKGAKHHFFNASRIWEKKAFDLHPFNSLLIANKAGLASLFGLEEHRFEFCKRASDIALKTSGKESLDYVYPQIELASQLFEFGRFDEFLELVDSMGPLVARHAKGHAALNLTFLRLKVISHLLRGNQIEQDRAIDKWIEFATVHLSTDFQSSLQSLSDACYFLLGHGRKQQAKTVLKRIVDGVVGKKMDTARSARTLASIGLMQFHIGDRGKAMHYMRRSVKSIKRFMEGEQFALLSERSQRNLKIGGTLIFNNYFHIALSVGADVDEISDIALFWKGLASVKNRSGNKLNITTKRLVRGLESGTAFVNIVEFTKAKLSKNGLKFLHEKCLLAIIIEAGKKTRIRELGESEAVGLLVQQWRAGVSSPKAASEQQQESMRAAARLKELVWDPLELKLPKDSLVCISPDSSLGSFSFDALPSVENGRLLIEDYRILNIPIPRMTKGKSGGSIRAAEDQLVAFGNIDYGKIKTGKIDRENGNAEERSVFEGGRLGLGPLAHSRNEIESVVQLFPKENVSVKQRSEATEMAFREVAPDCSLLLISSHAICEWRSSIKLVNFSGTTPSQRILNNLDLKSGIAFTNANESLGRHDEVFIEPSDNSDGFLYSAEIEKLDLSGLKVAFLSACSTGNGAPSGGEGLIGLSRSFQIAGARNTVATLWNVNDEATSKITAKFFELMRREELLPVDAMRQAKLWAISHRKDVKKIDSPRYALPAERRSDRLSAYYWAPFVVSGSLPLKK